MTKSPLFHRHLASRILRVLRAAAIVPVAVACNSNAGARKAGASSSGAGGSSGSSTASASVSGSSGSSTSSASSASSAGSSGAGGAVACAGTADCPCWNCVCTAASNYEIARDCIDGACATGVEACTAVCAQLNSTLATADAGPCSTTPADAGQPAVTACMPVPDAGVCSTNFGVVLQQFLALNCPNGFEPYEILSGPTSAPMGECCYLAHDLVCTAGGRPYVVDGRPRAATARTGEGWRGEGTPSLDGLTREARADLAGAWTAEAVAEHASVASFARFSLDLLAVGAPAHLVEAAHAAAIDEVRHASLCFALASAYSGKAVGPGTFPAAVSGVEAGELTLLSLAVSAASEGCVDETIFAALASERSLRATDPCVRRALAEIADDESRHAELAWRTVAWAIAEGGDEVRVAALRAIDGGIERTRAALAVERWPAGSEVYERHGVVSAADARRSLELAITGVVLPARRALHRVLASA